MNSDDLSGAVGKGVQPPDGTTERDAARYRWLCEQVAFGSWSIGIHKVIDKFGLTDDAYIDDKADADATIDAAMGAEPSMSTTSPSANSGTNERKPVALFWNKREGDPKLAAPDWREGVAPWAFTQYALYAIEGGAKP